MKVSGDLELQIWSFESVSRLKATSLVLRNGGYSKIEGNNAFKEHLIGNIPKIERKYFKGNFIDNPPLKKILLIIPFKVHSVPHSRHRCPV